MQFKLKVEDKVKWLAALRSGSYKQSRGALYNSHDNGYCCLGVAHKIGLVKTRYDTDPAMSGFVDPIWLDYTIQRILTLMNDADKMSFEEIADHIEKNY